jgi:hypothetical protein
MLWLRSSNQIKDGSCHKFQSDVKAKRINALFVPAEAAEKFVGIGP